MVPSFGLKVALLALVVNFASKWSKWSPSGTHVVSKWSSSDLSVSYLISSKRLFFENIANDGSFRHCTRLYQAVSGSAKVCHVYLRGALRC